MRSGVYYPYFLPPVEWVKTAALCWDEVMLPAPAEVAPPPWDWPEELRTINGALEGFLQQVGWHHPSAESEDHFASWAADRAATETQAGNAEWMPLFTEKFRPEGDLIPHLADLGLARPTFGGNSLQDAARIDLRRDVALGYVAICASECAESGGGDLAADGAIFTEPVLYSRQALRGDVAHAVLEANLPANVGGLDIAQIGEIRSEMRASRLEYHAEITALVEQLTKGVSSEANFSKVRNDIVEIATQRVEETRRTYSRAKVDVAVKALTVSLAPPALATWLASSLGIAIFAPAGLAAGLALLGKKLLSDLQAAKEQRASSPWSYVLESAKLVG
jgi:hypothetical protein